MAGLHFTLKVLMVTPVWQDLLIKLDSLVPQNQSTVGGGGLLFAQNLRYAELQDTHTKSEY